VFGHDRPGHRRLRAGRLGRAPLTSARAAAGAIATVLATTLGLFAAYVGGIVDDILNLITNVSSSFRRFRSHRITAFLHTRGLLTMTLVIACTLWRSRRHLRAQALTLKEP